MVILHQSVSGRCPDEKGSVKITYTGNMGVLISTDREAVWMDGLHKFYKPEFLPTDQKFIDKAKQREGDFRSLQWLLFSHYHRDHFDAGLTREIISSSPDIKISGAGQVVDSLSGAYTKNAWNRNGSLNNGEVESSVGIEAYNLQHTWPARHSAVQNIMFSVIVDGKRITHLGDSGDTDPAYAQKAFINADVLVVPYWLLLRENGKLLLKTSKAKTIIATHIEPGAKLSIELINGREQKVILFDVPGEYTEV